MGWLLFGVVGFLIFMAIAIYNRLVKLRMASQGAWADVDVQLKRRHNLVANLVETVKGYATHERETLEKVIQARNAAHANHGSPESQAKDENILSGALRQLFAVAEQYPDLKANTNFVELQKELTNTEDRIQRSRRFYNGNVRDLNNRIEMFPSNLIASMFGFTKREFFEIEEAAAREAVKVKF
jgi:LemA protein